MSEVEQRLCKYVILGTEKTDEGIEKPYNRESDFLTLKNIDEKFTAYDGIQDFKEEYEKQHGIKLENFNIQLLYYTNKSLGKVEMLPILFIKCKAKAGLYIFASNS